MEAPADDDRPLTGLDPDPGTIDRSRGFDPGFSLARHLTKTGFVTLVLAAVGIYLVRSGPVRALWGVPAYLLVGNLVEWTVHRFPMHRPMRPRILYCNHTLIHHRAFRGRAMEIETTQDLSLVMMPWYTLVMIFAAASPLMVLTGLVFGPGHAGTFLLAAVGYFVLYETIHTLDHLPARALPSRGPLAAALRFVRRHHHHHHQLRNMSRVNFNVTLPLADRLLGTYERPAASAE
ncbi:MAG: hypothetical protein D6705_16305 [Deltaproteobacteria bacterium]|nr:MAG: hypothetical protein D6705_16305 [Deltaproteobacteria bacterium]